MFANDGVYLWKWTDIWKGRKFDSVTVLDKDLALEFFEDLKKLKPKIIKELNIHGYIRVSEELIKELNICSVKYLDV